MAVSMHFTYIPTQNVKNLNKHVAMDLIRFTPGGISRVELAQRMDLTRAAITAIVDDLLKGGTVKEAPSRSFNTGRPPVTLLVNQEYGYVAGIDMGATHLTVIIADCAAHVVEEDEIPLSIANGPNFCIDQADTLLKNMLQHAHLKLGDLLTIGIGVPGPIVAEAGMVLAPPIMPGWDRFPIRATLEERWRHPVSLNNDAELGAIGEWAYGAGRSVDDLTYIKVGTGIGAGMLLNGHIYRGASGSAGEIGHVTIDENGPQCKCGNRGCLEAFAGGDAIASQARDKIRNGTSTQLAKMPLDRITTRDIIKEARLGDLVAQQILVQAGGHLGVAISSLVNLINPKMIILGGGVAQIGDLFLEPIRQVVQKQSLKAAAQGLQITTALLGSRSSGMGAIVQALSTAFHQIAIDKESFSELIFSPRGRV